MADSGEQPTADAEVHTLVNAIFEMLMEIDESKINISTQRLYLDKLLQDLHKQSPEVSAERLRKFMSMLQKTVQKHSNAKNAAEARYPARRFQSPCGVLGVCRDGARIREELQR